MTRPTQGQPRKGAIAPLTALLLIPLVALVAFALDLGWIVLIQSDLQSVADSAALAGSSPLMDGYVQYNLPNQSAWQQNNILITAKANARAAAKYYASLNNAGVKSLTLNDSDIEFGFTDAKGNYSNTSTNFPNTIKVTLRRDNNANTPVGLFFAPAIGTSSVSLTASAAATIYEANASGFNNVSNFKLKILPMTYDINNWKGFLATGQNPDGSALTDSNGNPEIQVYPSIKDTGNFGLFSLSDSHVGASTISSWIDNGMQQSDVQALINTSTSDQVPLIPLAAHNSANNGTPLLPANSTDGLGSWNWVGDTGLKQSDVSALGNYVGQTYLLPLFIPLDGSVTNYTAGNGTGSNYYFNIVQFVSVKIVSTSGGVVIVQPSPTVLDYSQIIFDPNSPPIPAGSGSTTTATTFTAPKLSQ